MKIECPEASVSVSLMKNVTGLVCSDEPIYFGHFSEEALKHVRLRTKHHKLLISW